MPDQKVSQLTDAGSLTGAELLPVIQAGLSRKALLSLLSGLIQEQLLGADSSIVTFNNIPQTFRHLFLKIYARHTEATSDNYILMRLNNDSGANYDFQHALFTNVTSSVSASFAQTSFRISDFPGANSNRATQMGLAVVEIPHYTGTTFEKLMIARGGGTWLTAGNGTGSQINSGGWRNIGAITRIDVFPTSGNLRAGSMLSLYGSY